MGTQAREGLAWGVGALGGKERGLGSSRHLLYRLAVSWEWKERGRRWMERKGGGGKEENRQG